jgi:hypothetical protein
MSLGAVYRSYQLVFHERDEEIMLLRSSGESLVAYTPNAQLKFWSPMLGLGVEYKMKNLGMLYAQFNTNGAPVNKNISNNAFTFKQKGTQWVVGLRFNF